MRHTAGIFRFGLPPDMTKGIIASFMDEILLISEDSLFARMLYLEFVQLHKTVTIRGTLTPDALEAVIAWGTCRLLILDLDGVYPALDRMLNMTVEQNLPVILFGYPDSDAMTAEKLRFYDSDIYRYVFPRPFLMNQFLYCAKELLHYREDVLSERTEAPAMKMKQHSPADDLHINEEAHTVCYRNDTIPLTRTEYDILLLLLRQRGAVLSRAEISAAIRSREALSAAEESGSSKKQRSENSNLVDVYIRYLRAKLDQTYKVTLIETVRGVGYTIRK